MVAATILLRLMKHTAIFILILAIFAQTFSKWIVVVSFNVNRDYIAKNLCEKRNLPGLNCNGSCVLMKKMKQESKKDQKDPGSLKEDIAPVVLSSRSFFATAALPVFESDILHCAMGSWGKPIDRAFSIFHPPVA